MKTMIRAMLVVVGAATAAQAADTTIKYEVSTDGLNWSSSLNAQPGTQIQVRTRVIWTGATQVYGLEQVTFQPIVSNWTAADHLETTAGTPVNAAGPLNPNGSEPGGVGPVGGGATSPSGNVPDAPGVWGRVTPFGLVVTTTSSYLRGFLGTGTASGLLRIAQANITNWIGVGPTSGSGAVNNTNARGGVVVGQFPPGIPDRFGTPDFLPGTDVVVFKFGFTLSTATASRSLSIDTPLAGISIETNRGPNYGRRVAYWATSPNDLSITGFYDSIAAAPAFVNVVPAPGIGILAMAAGVFATRRRR